MNNNTTARLYRNDVWSLDDDFGLGAAGDQVARMALEVDPPFTVGVTGKWGCGKTSVMRRAFATLGGKPIQQPLMFSDSAGLESHGEDWDRWHCATPDREPSLGHWPAATNETAEQTFSVWYSPWQHQNEDNPLVPLIREIQNQFTAWLKLRQALGDFNRQAGLAGAKLLEHLADAALSLTAGRTVKVARGLTDAMRSGWKEAEDGLTALSDGQRFHLLFEDAIQQVLKARSDNGEIRDSARLVIFIDDLDRWSGAAVTPRTATRRWPFTASRTWSRPLAPLTSGATASALTTIFGCCSATCLPATGTSTVGTST